MKTIGCGVYFLYDGEKLVYIGQSTNILYRIGQHIKDGQKKFDNFRFYETDDYIRLEAFLIGALKPKYNKTEGTLSVGSDEWRKDVFSEAMPKEEILSIIGEYESKVGRRYYVRKIAKEHSWMDAAEVSRQIIRHYNELPIYRIDGEWFIDADWYDKNKRELENLTWQWFIDSQKAILEQLDAYNHEKAKHCTKM